MIKIIITFILIVLVFSVSAQTEEFVESVNYLHKYDFGDSREPLTDIESQIFENTDPAIKKIMAATLASVLNNNSSFAAKQFVCHQLSVIGTAAEVPVLEKMLSNPKQSDMARFALQQISGQEAEQALIRALTITDIRIKIGIINSLGERRSDTATKIMGELLLSDNAELVTATATALSKTGTKNAAVALGTGLEKCKDTERKLIARHYLYCADNMLAGGLSDPALEIYQKLNHPDYSLWIRTRAEEKLVAINKADPALFIRKAIESDDPLIREPAIRFIRTAPRNQTSFISDQLEHLHDDAKILLIMALTDRGDSACLTTIQKYVNYDNSKVSVSAITSLGSLGNDSSIPILIGKLHEGNESEKEAATNSLIRIKGVNINGEISKYLNGAEQDLQITIINIFIKRHAVNQRATIMKYIADSNPDIRRTAWNALGKLGNETDLTDLIYHWKNVKDHDDYIAIENAIVDIIRRSDEKTFYVDLMVSLFEKNESTNLHESILAVLGRIGNESALPVLQRSTKSQNITIRKAAVRALASWPDDLPISDLKKIAEEDPDNTVKILALRGYIDMIGLDEDRNPKEKLGEYAEAMNLAFRSDEKILVMNGLADIYEFESILYIEKYLNDSELHGEAAAAIINVSQDIAPDITDEAQKSHLKTILKSIIDGENTTSIQNDAQSVLDKLK